MEKRDAGRDAGQYTHHTVTTLEFEIKRHLNLDVSFIWDYLQNPQAKSDGEVPKNGDFYLNVDSQLLCALRILRVRHGLSAGQ